MSHTHAPWKAKNKPVEIWANDEIGNVHIATLTQGLGDEGEANARLIAAAPELLENLLYIRDQINSVKPKEVISIQITHEAAGQICALAAKLKVEKVDLLGALKKAEAALGLAEIDWEKVVGHDRLKEESAHSIRYDLSDIRVAIQRAGG